MQGTEITTELPALSPEQLEKRLNETITAGQREIAEAVANALEVEAEGASDPEERTIYRMLLKRNLVPTLLQKVAAPAFERAAQVQREILAPLVRAPEPPPIELPESKPVAADENDPLYVLEQQVATLETEVHAAARETGDAQSQAEAATEHEARASSHKDQVRAEALRGLRPKKDVRVAEDQHWETLCKKTGATDKLAAIKAKHADLPLRLQLLNGKRELLAQCQAIRIFDEKALEWNQATFTLQNINLELRAIVSASFTRWNDTRRIGDVYLPAGAGLPPNFGFPDGILSSSNGTRTMFDGLRKMLGERNLSLLSDTDPIKDEIIRTRRLEEAANRQARINAGPFTVDEKEDRRRRGL
ncbi:MAG TPA: hypothetical protein VG096_24130 [Bryobacteraceae bacterium]|jgi:hypothetical protein|nr:hypothetical protein [Bryobacteraceae bacterium]